jgi:PAS domain S-box-containing protein
MGFSFFRSIRTHLLLLVFVTILPAVGIILYTGLNLRAREINAVETGALSALSELKAKHQHAVESTHQFLLTLSKIAHIRNLDPNPSNELLAQLLEENPLYGIVFVLDAQGDLISSGLPFEPINLKFRKYFKDIVRTKSFSVGDRAICKAINQPGLHLAYPIHNDLKQFNGLVVVSLDIQRYARTFSLEKLPQGSTLSVMDGKGELIYQISAKNEVPFDEKFIEPFSPSTTAPGVFAVSIQNGVRRLKAYKQLSLSKNEPPYLYFHISIPQKEALLKARKILNTNLTLLGLSLVIALTLAWFLGNSIIVRRLAKLVKASRRLEKGQLTTRTGLRYKHDELGVLSDALDEMARTLQTKNIQRTQAEAAIISVAEEWRSTFDAIPDPVMLLDHNFKIIRGNRATEAFFGLPVTEISGNDCYELVYGMETPPADCPYKKLEDTKRHVEEEIYLSAKNLWTLVTLDPFFGKDGRIKGTVNTIKDITKRKKAELALRESENKFRDLAEKSVVGVFIVQDDLFRYANESLARINGYTVAQLIDKKGPRDLTHPDDLPMLKAILGQSATGTQSSHQFDCRGITETGETLYVEIFATQTIYRQRPAVVGMAMDVTDRKHAQEELTTERKRFRTLADYAPYGMVLFDNTGKIKYLNPRFSQLFGYELKDIPDGRTWFKKAYPDSKYRKKVVATWRTDYETLSTGKKIPHIFTVTCKDGSKKEISFSPVRLNTGEILTVSEDITERKQLEAQLLHARKMEAIGTLAGGIAHDFNNLLMGILGYTSLMLMKIDPQDAQYEILKSIERQLQSGAELTKQLLGFARGGKYELKAIDLNELLNQTADMFGRTKKEIRIENNLFRNLWKAAADRGQIEQVLLNLFVNAWHAMPGGGTLRIESENVELDSDRGLIHDLSAGKYVRIVITDNGIGMDKNTQQRIFEPFFTTKKMGRGTGLGLASAYGIIKNHNGTIEVRSKENNGTTFYIYIPASFKKAVEKKTLSGRILKGSETLLLVDDQESIREVSQDMLTALGYHVLLAESGGEAIEIFKKRKAEIELVILDMIMPEMSGGDTFDVLRKIEPEVKVVLSSGYSLNGQAAQILERGCNGFIQKPFSIEVLSQKLREVLD